jgi:hypothetical protein
MTKNYILAAMLSFGSLVAFGQSKDYFVGKLGGVTVTVDGNMDEIYGLSNRLAGMSTISNCIVLDNACGIVTPATNCTGSAKFAAVYNDEKLYVYAEVMDATPSSLVDGVELFFSMKNDRTSNCPGNWPRGYDAATFQIISTNPTGTLAVESPNGQIANITASASKAIAGGYSIEFELDFFEADFLSGLTVELGRKIGFDISVNQGEGGPRISQMMWSACCGDRNWTEATNFGTLTLDDVVATNKLTSLINSVSLAPNPANNMLKLTVNAKNQDELAVSIINSLSQKVYSNTFNTVAGETFQEINTSNLAEGIYTVVLSKNGLNTTEKLVIKK